MDDAGLEENMLLGIYVWIWLLFGIFSVAFYALAPPHIKLPWHPWILFVLHALILGIIVLLYPRWDTLGISTSILGVVYYGILRCIRFCPRCGSADTHTIHNSTAKCRSCGVVIE